MLGKLTSKISKMENKATLLLSYLILSCFTTHIVAKMPMEAFYNTYKGKLLTKAKDMDVSEFNVREHFPDAQILSQDGLKEKDRIDSLPGQPGKVNFNQYGGYVTVDEKAGRALFYYFVEAQSSPDKSPLLLWLSGGPGCSSLGLEAMEELGPFRVDSDGKTLYKNNLAWNQVANVIFLETPAGVGFSYSKTKDDVVIGGDKKTTTDNHVFLLNWFERFPEHKDRDFYIGGKNYGGHFVPQLTKIILDHNNKANKTIIKLKGIIIGNAVINDETDAKGAWLYFGGQGFLSDDTTKHGLRHCNFSSVAITQTRKCEEAVDEAENELGYFDYYNIYAPLCFNYNLTAKPTKINPDQGHDPCSDYYVSAYLNRAEVQKALHANVTNITYDWQICSNVIEEWKDSPLTVIPILKEIMAEGLRLWLYSGDFDGVLPFTSTQLSIKTMKLHIKRHWRPWYNKGEVGGHMQVYDNLIFATLRGAGHQAPADQPTRALSLIMHFLKGTPLPDSSIY